MPWLESDQNPSKIQPSRTTPITSTRSDARIWQVRIFPDKQQLATLRPPLMPGERALIDYLDRFLPPQWRIYAQPYINNMRPDVVVLHPGHGIVVFEVKDWTTDIYHFENGSLIRQTEIERRPEDNPLLKARWYADQIYRQFLATDEAELPVGADPNNLALCRHGIYFHNACEDEVRKLFGPFLQDNDIILGRDSLTEAKLGNAVPYYRMQRSRFLRDRQREALLSAHTWLCPPEHAVEQQAPLPPLSAEQRPYGTPETGFRRIRGVAGAGKSFVLAHRAARANAQGKKILVLSFNITMSHVLHDLLKRAPYPTDWREITWSHFHGWVKTQAVESGKMPISERTLRRNEFGLQVPVAELVEEFALAVGGQHRPIVEIGNVEAEEARLLGYLNEIADGQDIAEGYAIPSFDGIYIDEAQDFEPRWLDTLARFLKPDGEFVIFADHRQNLYGKDGGRNGEGMPNCRFRGPWAQLPRKSYRIPWRISLFLNDFVEQVAVGDEEDYPIEQYAEHDPNRELPFDILAWRRVDHVRSAIAQIPDAVEALGNPNPNDVVVLLPTHESGVAAVEQMLPDYHQVVHVFGGDGANGPETRRRKVAFWMGRGGLKMCTIHSFKGWEIANVILVWPTAEELDHIAEAQRNSIFYTAISRGLRNMVVLNANRDFDVLFRDWDGF